MQLIEQINPAPAHSSSSRRTTNNIAAHCRRHIGLKDGSITTDRKNPVAVHP
jgi:hypothetical protein